MPWCRRESESPSAYRGRSEYLESFVLTRRVSETHLTRSRDSNCMENGRDGGTKRAREDCLSQRILEH